MLAAAICAVLSIALFVARFVLLASEFRFGSMGAISLAVAFVLVLSAFFVSDEPSGDRSGPPIFKAEDPIAWHLSYLSLVVAAVLFVVMIWRAFA